MLQVCGLKWSPNKEYLASGGNLYYFIIMIKMQHI